MSKIAELLENIPKLNMSVKPTPIVKLERISNKYDSNIYCMRDDLTGFAFGGNKTRKLDFLIADALKKGKDTIIGIGANQSNFCRMAAAAAKVNAMEAHLVLAGTEPEKPTGNLLVDQLFGAIIHHIDTTDDNVLLAKAKELEKQLMTQGRKVYNMPAGGSTSVGILGYVDAFDEIMQYSERTGIHFSTIFHSSGTGGTQSGLVLGQQIAGWKGKIIGISVGRSCSELDQLISNLINNATQYLSIVPENQGKIIIDDNYFGKCYGARTVEAYEAITTFANYEGIMLDHVYTGKGASGMIDYLKKGLINKTENILFIHTGGNIELFE